MRLFKNLFRRGGAQQKSTAMAMQDISNLFQYGREAKSGVTVNWTTAIQIAAVFACVKVLAESVAQLPLELRRRSAGGIQALADNHPLYEILLLRPNSWQSAFEFREMLMWHVVLTGTGFAFINRLSDGTVTELIPLLPQNVTTIRHEDYSFTYRVRDDFGRIAEFTQDEIFVLRGPSWTGWNALEPVRLLREALGLAIATEEHAARLFANGARISGVLQTDKGLRQDVVERIRAQFSEMYSGVGNTGKTAILEDGLKFQTVSMNAAEAQLIEARKFQILEICRIFRVPPHLVAELDRSTNNNIEHQGLEFVTYTLTPWLVRWEQGIACQLLNPRERARYFAKHSVDELLRGDIQSRYTAYGQARQWGFMCVDEIRAKEGMNPLPNDEGKIYLQPSNMIDTENSLLMAIPKPEKKPPQAQQ